MLFFATLMILLLAMAGLGLGILCGQRRARQAGCGIDCRCVPDRQETGK